MLNNKIVLIAIGIGLIVLLCVYYKKYHSNNSSKNRVFNYCPPGSKLCLAFNEPSNRVAGVCIPSEEYGCEASGTVFQQYDDGTGRQMGICFNGRPVGALYSSGPSGNGNIFLQCSS